MKLPLQSGSGTTVAPVPSLSDFGERVSRNRQRAILVAAILAGLAMTATMTLADWHDFQTRSWEAVYPAAAVVAFWITLAAIYFRRRSVRALRRDEERLKTLLDAAPIAMLITYDHDGTILYANPHCHAVLGKPNGTLTGDCIGNYYCDPEDRRELRATLLETGEVVDFEVRFRRADGTPVWVSTTNRLGTLYGEQIMIGGFVDITVRKEADKALLRERQQTALILDAVDEGVVFVDTDGMIRRANPAACRILGSDGANLVGQPVHVTACVTCEHRSPVAPGVCPLQLTLREGGEHQTADAWFQRRDETVFPAEYAVRALHDEDRVVGAVLTFRDISLRKQAEEELRASEQRYRNVVDHIGIGVCLLSPKMEVLTLNKQMRDWNPNVDVTTRPICYRAFNNPPRDAVCSYCPVKLTLADGCVHEATTETPSGDTVRNYRVVATPIRDQNGSIVAAIEMVEDVTERLQAEEQRRQHTQNVERLWEEQTRLSSELSESYTELELAKQETEEALAKLKLAQTSMVQSEKMASIGVLAAGIAHEINNPVGFVSSNLRELITYAGKVQTYLKKVKTLEDRVAAGEWAEADRSRRELADMWTALKLSFVVEDLCKVAHESLEGTSSIQTIVEALRMYARQDDDVRTTLDLRQIVDNSLRVVWNQIKFKATVTKNYDEVAAISGSAGALQQVFSNLLVNAAQAIRDHGVIELQISQLTNSVAVIVRDNGSGIKPEHLPRIFEPFFTTKDVGEGTGLGLSITYDIVKKHCGNISIESEPGKGTSVTVCLPVGDAKTVRAIGVES